MKHTKWILFSAAILMALLQPVWAVTPSGGAGSAPSVNIYGTVEHGGVITAINQELRTITVDGVSYPLSFDYVPIHSDGPPVPINIFKLKQGTKIRFNTLRDSGGQNRVNEIWVTKQDSNTKQSK